MLPSPLPSTRCDLVTLAAYGGCCTAAINKRAAAVAALALLGGWGSLVAVSVLRHKSRKLPFLVMLWLIIALHTALWAVMAYAGLLSRTTGTVAQQLGISAPSSSRPVGTSPTADGCGCPRVQPVVGCLTTQRERPRLVRFRRPPGRSQRPRAAPRLLGTN